MRRSIPFWGRRGLLRQGHPRGAASHLTDGPVRLEHRNKAVGFDVVDPSGRGGDRGFHDASLTTVHTGAESLELAGRGERSNWGSVLPLKRLHEILPWG